METAVGRPSQDGINKGCWGLLDFCGYTATAAISIQFIDLDGVLRSSTRTTAVLYFADGAASFGYYRCTSFKLSFHRVFAKCNRWCSFPMTDAQILDKFLDRRKEQECVDRRDSVRLFDGAISSIMDAKRSNAQLSLSNGKARCWTSSAQHSVVCQCSTFLEFR